MNAVSSAALTPQLAQAAIDARITVLPAEVRALRQCLGQTLRQDVYAERDNPPFDRVCMDGIAIDSAALARGVRRYSIEAMQPAGAPALTLNAPEHAVEVMTGAILPRGTDCVIPLEEYELREGVASLKADVQGPAFRNVQRRGEDSQPGVPMLRAGMRLGGPEIGVAASAGLPGLLVSRQPRLMVISTGDELIEPGQPIAAHQVRRSNAYAVAAELCDQGFECVADDHIPDDEQRLRERLASHLAERDVLVVSGGISKGRFDLVPKVLKGLGVAEVFHQVAQRPGAPMWFGVGPRTQLVFGLPGNPVSTLICLVRYVVPALGAAMAGPRPIPQPVALAAPVKSRRMLSYFMPVTVEHDAAGRPAARARPPNGPGDFLALAGTDGFIELPPGAEPFPEGFIASLYRWARCSAT
jgi:molybdopterin molybdotransferase